MPDPFAEADLDRLASPDPVAIERAAAAAWASAVAEEAGGWLLRLTPGVAHRRNNSALPMEPPLDPSVVERFYDARGAPPIVAVAPAEGHGALDAGLEARGWIAEGGTEVLVAPPALAAPAGPLDVAAAAYRARQGGAVRRVDPLAWPNEAVRDGVLARSAGELAAFAEGDDGAVLCIRVAGLAGVFRLHVAPAARRRGVARRLLAACAGAFPGAGLYAQVERDNAPALALFRGAGFARSHGYHYRRRPRG